VRYARRADENQKAIAAALRTAGAIVFLTHAVGQGFPDAVVGYGGKTYLLEIKRERGPKGGNRMTGGRSMAATSERQEKFRATWRGGPVYVVRSTGEAFDVVVRGLAPVQDHPRDEREHGAEGDAGE
jgi:hypothetical protein